MSYIDTRCNLVTSYLPRTPYQKKKKKKIRKSLRTNKNDAESYQETRCEQGKIVAKSKFQAVVGFAPG